nr:transposase (putative), gypsy type [Tanacetum cinerariifolium]
MNGWISFSKLSGNAPVYYMKPLDSLKNWNDHFLWVDSFACPTLFPWHTAKNVNRDPAPVAADFNAQDYATIVSHPSPFRKFPKEFMCLVGLSRHYTLDEETYPRFLHKNEEDMNLFAFIHTPDPTKVKVVERKRVKDEPLLLQTTVGRTVPLLLVAPDRADSELETSIDKLFDEGGSGSQAGQGDFAGVGEGTNIQPVTESTDIVTEDVAPLQPRRQGEPIPTFPFVTYFVSAMPEHDGGDHTDSMTGLNLRTISAPQRSSVPVMTAVTTTTSTADPAVVVKEKTAKPSLFAVDSSSAAEVDPNVGVFSDLTGSDFLSVTNGSRLNDGRVCREMVDEFSPPKFFASVQRMEHDQLFTKFNVRVARQMSLSAEVRMRAEEKEVEELKAQLLLKEAEAAEAIRLCAEASKFEAVKKSLQDGMKALKERNASLEKERDALDVKLLTHGMKLAITKCLHSPEYLYAHRAAIGKAIEKGMRDELSAGITHGAKGRVLADVAAYNFSAKADYISALQHLQNINFSLLAELRSNKDASLMVPIHHSSDKVVAGATTLSLSLDVSNIRAWKIRENIASQRSALHDVFVPLSEPFFAEVLTGAEGTSDTVLATAVTTTALSTTLASASTVPPMFVDDYEVAGMDDQTGVDGNADLFPNVDDVELNIP